MLKWESHYEDIKNQCVELVVRTNRDVRTIGFPDAHLKSVSLSLSLFELAKDTPTQFVVAMKFIKPIDHMSLSPNVKHCEYFILAAQMFLTCGTLQAINLAKHYAQRAMCDLKVMFGRETVRTEQGYGILSDALSRLLHPEPCVTECGFCGETPHFASFYHGLGVCNGCSHIAYCSLSCQKVHWNVHKNVCRNADWLIKKKSGEVKENTA
jgi:hypothetical protein